MRRVILAASVLFAACATLTPPASQFERWQSDLRAYREQLQRFQAQAQALLEEFRALRTNPSFPAVEEKIRDLAARTGSGAQQNPSDLLRPTLRTMSLGELLAFTRFLSLSTRWMTLEATRSELESTRLELWVRRISLEKEAARGIPVVRTVGLPAEASPVDPALVEQSVPALLSCRTSLVGSLTFATCE